jgi:hypothetical protein
VIHLIGEHLEDISAELATLSQPSLAGPLAAQRPAGVRHRHPRDVRVLPRSRDFH